MLPSPIRYDFPYIRTREAEGFSERPRGDSSGMLLPHPADINGGHLTVAVSFSFRRAAMLDHVLRVLLVDVPSKVTDVIVKAVAVVVARLMTFWAWSDERVKDQSRDEVHLYFAVDVEADNGPLLRASRWMKRGDLQRSPLANSSARTSAAATEKPTIVSDGVATETFDVAHFGAVENGQWWNVGYDVLRHAIPLIRDRVFRARGAVSAACAPAHCTTCLGGAR
jgi:hypothetical protein